MPGKIDKLEKFANSCSSWLNWVAGVALVGMLALIAADIIGAKLFKWPIPGGIEMVGFLGVVVVAFAIAQTQILHGHIEVEFLVTRLPETAQRAISGIVYSLGMVLFALLAWQSYDFGHILQISGEVSMTQGIPFYPVVYGIAICCIAVFLVLLVQFIRAVTKTKK
jgi:TRAP-type C4-dicarboxylate transport system permease small subunit